jgi:hypothetical protein
MMLCLGNLMILGGMFSLDEGVRLRFITIQGLVMDRSSFLRDVASSKQ